MKRILCINDYKAQFPGSFIAGQLELAKFMHEKGDAIFFIFPERKEYLEQLERIASVYYISEFSGTKFSLHFYKRLKKLVQFEKIDIIHTNFGFSGFFAATLITLFSNVQHISHERALPSGIIKSVRFIRFIKRITFRLLNAVSNNWYIAISNEVKSALEIYNGYPDFKIFVIPNAVVYKEPKNIELPFQYDSLVGMIAHWGTQKDHETYIKSATKVRESVNNLKYIQIGNELQLRNEDYYPKIKHWLNEYKVNDIFYFTGSVENTQDYVFKMDVCCLISHFEGFGNAVVEYMLQKKPVIATAVGGLKDVIIDGETGFLIEPENANQLAEKIIFLIQNPDIAQKMGEKGYMRARSLYGIENWLQRVYDVYTKISIH